MEHICRNCEHWNKSPFLLGGKETGTCIMLKQVRQALGYMPELTHDTSGKKINQQEYGVHVGAEYGKDCEYFTPK